jgi:hypothetical protein
VYQGLGSARHVTQLYSDQGAGRYAGCGPESCWHVLCDTGPHLTTGTVLAAEVKAADASLGYQSGAAREIVKRMAPHGEHALLQMKSICTCSPTSDPKDSSSLPHLLGCQHARGWQTQRRCHFQVVGERVALIAHVQAYTLVPWGTSCISWRRPRLPGRAVTGCSGHFWRHCELCSQLG